MFLRAIPRARYIYFTAKVKFWRPAIWRFDICDAQNATRPDFV